MPLGAEYQEVAETVIEVSYTDDKFTQLANDEAETLDVDIPDVSGRPVRRIKEAAYEFLHTEITEDLGYTATAALRSVLDDDLTDEEEAIGEVIVYSKSNSNEIAVLIVVNNLDDLMDKHGSDLGFLHSKVTTTDFLQKLGEMHENRRLQYTEPPEVLRIKDDRPDFE